MNPEMTEILIGKFLDSEITPAEQRLLQRQLEDDPEARKLLEQLQQLRDQAGQALAEQLGDTGEPAAAIFEAAWQESIAANKKGTRGVGRWWRFAAGMAAGFALALAVLAAWQGFNRERPANSESPEQIANANDSGTSDVTEPVLTPGPETPESESDEQINRRGQPNRPRAIVRQPRRPGRRVDYYNYTDRAGDRWLVETYRDRDVQPAAYHGGM